ERVERAKRAYAILYSAVDEDVQAMVRTSLVADYAYGLWEFLEKKYQNTDKSHVAELLRRWVALRAGEDESFDSYRARVDEVRHLLRHAKEPVTNRGYRQVLLDRLQ